MYKWLGNIKHSNQTIVRNMSIKCGFEKEDWGDIVHNKLRNELHELQDACWDLGTGVGTLKDLSLEAADMAIYLYHLANLMEFDLDTAIKDKIKTNLKRFRKEQP